MKCDNPPTFEVWSQTATGVDAGGPLYTSKALDEKSGDAGKWKEAAYTDSISVDAECAGCTGRYLAFVFHNNAHNVQVCTRAQPAPRFDFQGVL